MCGIVGYIGESAAVPILLEGLKKLEYRGYDSAGIAVLTSGEIQAVKKKGRIEQLEQNMGAVRSSDAHCGIGHTRWATHGEPVDANAHPHFNREKTIGIVHNGIIENYLELKKKMESRGYLFASETDSEVIVHMLDYYNTGSPVETIDRVLRRLKGSYALEILFCAFPDTIYCVRKDSPLAIGTAEDGCYIASDAPAIISHTRTVYYPENGEIAVVTEKGPLFYNEDGELLEKEPVQLELDENAADKGDYQHFMMKEIQEQPQAVSNLLSHYGWESKIPSEFPALKKMLTDTKRIRIVACGSAYHAGMAGKYVFESLARIPVEVDLASEFRYRNPILEKQELVIVISQSGETADTLAALREAKEKGVQVLAIVNAEGSSIAREADAVLYTYAGPEISVATTKGYSTQLIMLYLLAIELAYFGEQISSTEYENLYTELEGLPRKISQVLTQQEVIQKIANRCFNHEHVFFIGRGMDYGTALEGALKLKEVSYIHAEAYAAGELKHGTIALIEKGSLIIALQTQPPLYEKMRSNILETKTRGAQIIEVGLSTVSDNSEYTLEIPDCHPLFTPTLAIIPLQLFAYYISAAKAIDVDKPRNLAKSVTVE